MIIFKSLPLAGQKIACLTYSTVFLQLKCPPMAEGMMSYLLALITK